MLTTRTTATILFHDLDDISAGHLRREILDGAGFGIKAWTAGFAVRFFIETKVGL